MNGELKIKQALVTVDWLFKNRDAANLVIIDATMPKVTDGKNTFEDQNIQIPNARYLDIKNVFSNTSAQFPNTMLAVENFQEQVRLLGINKNSAIIVYDAIGIYSSPRVWWMFKSMGHRNIAVLDGGLPEWISKGYTTEQKIKHSVPKGDFTVKYNPKYFKDHTAVLKAIDGESATIVDARSYDRFMGLVDEPREGLRSGHIPSSKNVPYSDLLVDGKLKSKDLQSTFKKLISNDKELIFTCGSGITACILALGAETAGLTNISVYDGSWTEWGSLHELPIEK